MELFTKLCSDESDDEEELLLDETLILGLERELSQGRKCWVHETIFNRQELGEFHRLIQKLQSDVERFKKYFRLSKVQFDEVLQLVEKDISKETTHF